MAGSARRELLLSPSEVERRYQLMPPYESQEFDHTLGSMVVGSPESCREKIHHLIEGYGCNEIAVLTVTYRYEDRLQSYQLLARALCIDTDTGN